MPCYHPLYALTNFLNITFTKHFLHFAYWKYLFCSNLFQFLRSQYLAKVPARWVWCLTFFLRNLEIFSKEQSFRADQQPLLTCIWTRILSITQGNFVVYHLDFQMCSARGGANLVSVHKYVDWKPIINSSLKEKYITSRNLFDQK